MLPFQNYYGIGSRSSSFPQECFLPHGMDLLIDGAGSTITSRSSADKKSIAACKSHSEAERRRRERINGHLRTLRSLLPNTIKTDKASLLAEVVQQVRDLKKCVADVAAGGQGTSELELPSETDELRLSLCESDESSSSSSIKVVMCCEDRVDLLKDLTEAMRVVRGRLMKAELATVGGRTKSEFVIQAGGEEEELMGTLRRTLKAVMDKSSGLSGSGQGVLGNKRPRLSHHHQIY